MIKKDSELSSKEIENELYSIRKNLTKTLGNDNGRVYLKEKKPLLQKRLQIINEKLAAHKNIVEKKLKEELDKSKEQIVSYYLEKVTKNPPETLIAETLTDISSDIAKNWIMSELDKNDFPKPENLIKKMSLSTTYKDITFETLNNDQFIKDIKKAYSNVDWDKLYEEFKAAKEKSIEK